VRVAGGALADTAAGRERVTGCGGRYESLLAAAVAKGEEEGRAELLSTRGTYGLCLMQHA
jgi:hypothetical protein